MARTKSPQSEIERVQERALAALAQLGGSTTSEDDILFEGQKFILPATLGGDLRQAIKLLERKHAEEEKEFAFAHQFKYRPLDGAVATGNVIKDLFGMTLGKAIQTFFGEDPPKLIDVAVGVDETVQAPWGAMEVPGLPGLTLYLDSATDAELGQVFLLHGEGPRKYRFIIDGLFKAIEAELARNSIYRGKAITGQPKPNFLDLSSVNPATVVYSDDVLAQLTAEVWTPIRKADQLADLGEPGKRTVIFEGPYGTGKTLGAYLTALEAVEAGWTFLMVRPGRDDLESALATARMYQPAVIFTEDIDTQASEGSAEHMARMLDLFDGLDTKGLRLITVLTTNNVETLHPGMLRPGRLDAVISIAGLDLNGVRKLAHVVFGERKLAKDIDWDKVFLANEGYTPAFIREGFGRVIRYQLARGDSSTVTTDDLVHAANGLRAQYDLMVNAAAPKDRDPSFKELVVGAVEEAASGLALVDSDDDITHKVVPGQHDSKHYESARR